MIAVLETISIGILVFFLIYCVATVTLLAMSVREISWYARGRGPARTRRSELARRPSVSLVTPAYNEEALIVQSAKAFLVSDYAPLEVVVDDDGSRDETFARLVDAFDLVSLPLRGSTVLASAPIRGVHMSRTEPRLRVVHKDNGGRSDAINAGISVARGELVVSVDADSLPEPQAITRAIVPFEVHPDHCMAVGGGIRVANGSRIVGGRLVAPEVSMRGVGATQVLEYLRGFFATRIAWSEMNGMLIISGAFGVFRRDLLVAPRFGAAGTFAMPYLVLFEALEPLVEALGFAIVITLLIDNAVNWTYLLAFFLVAVLTGEVLSATSLLIEEIGFRRYRAKDLAALTLWGLVEALWFRPALAWWRLKATALALIGRRPGWGVIPRGEAILEHPVHFVAPLTR